MCTDCIFTVFALDTLLSNYILPNQLGLHGVSRLVCAKTCSERPSCKSFFYTPTTQSCLLSHRYVQDTAGLVPSNGTRFYSKPLPGCITKEYSFIAKINTCVLDQSAARKSWFDARTFCRDHHGLLMKAHTAERHKFFVEFGRTKGYPDLHIGATKVLYKWQWIDRTPVTIYQWRSSGQDTNLFAAMYNTYLQYCWCDGAYTWDDCSGRGEHGFLCEAL